MVTKGDRPFQGCEGYRVSIHLGGWATASIASAEVGESPALDVNVIFTTAQATMTALKTAQGLARSLNARIRLLVPQVVPLQFSFTSPPVSIPFTENRCRAVANASLEDVDIHVQVYLCGDKRQCLLKVLKPEPLVVMGGRKRWWVTPEQRLARFLESAGLPVIFMDEEDAGAGRAKVSLSAHSEYR